MNSWKSPRKRLLYLITVKPKQISVSSGFAGSDVWGTATQDILTAIFFKCCLDTLKMAALVCKTWHRVSVNEGFWKLRYDSYIPGILTKPQALAFTGQPHADWRQKVISMMALDESLRTNLDVFETVIRPALAKNIKLYGFLKSFQNTRLKLSAGVIMTIHPDLRTLALYHKCPEGTLLRFAQAQSGEYYVFIHRSDPAFKKVARYFSPLLIHINKKEGDFCKPDLVLPTRKTLPAGDWKETIAKARNTFNATDGKEERSLNRSSSTVTQES